MGNPYRTILRLPLQPYEVALDVYRANDANQKVVNNMTTTFSNGIKMAPDGDSIVYYYDIDASIIKQCCNFAILWKIRNTAVEPQQFIYQNLQVITPKVLVLVTCLRMLIDKLQKRLGVVQAYEDSDLVEFLSRGAELVNAGYPTTFFSYNMMPSALTVHHLLYSGWYALQAQGLLATELAFSFSGQTVTLDYDQAGGLSELAGRWQEFLTTTLPAIKMAIVRRNSPVGTVAGRQYRITDINLFTFKTSTSQGSTSQIMGQMTTLGLLY